MVDSLFAPVVLHIVPGKTNVRASNERRRVVLFPITRNIIFSQTRQLSVSGRTQVNDQKPYVFVVFRTQNGW